MAATQVPKKCTKSDCATPDLGAAAPVTKRQLGNLARRWPDPDDQLVELER